jgi:aminoglycoside phosphotransferase (APT) family kinase protein
MLVTEHSTNDRAMRTQADACAERLCAELQLSGQLMPLRDGREHHLYRLVHTSMEHILKFPRKDAIPDPFDPNRSALERLQGEAIAIGLASNVPVPKDYRVFSTSPPCALMSLMPGITPEMVYERGRMDFTGLMGVCVQMGRVLATIHSRKRPEGGAGLPDLPGADPAASRLLHLDYHLGNVLGVPHTGWQITGVLDWTCARWGPPEADLTELQVSVFVGNPRARDAFVAGYRQVSGRALDLSEVDRRSAREIERRLIEDPPELSLQEIWKGWLRSTGFRG